LKIAITFGAEKLKWWSYHMVEKIQDMFAHELDRQADTQAMHASIGCTMHRSRGKNCCGFLNYKFYIII